MRCEDDKSNLCRRVLRQMLEQNREKLTECQENQDGEWEAWKDLEPCRSLSVHCGAQTGLHTGFKGQTMRCKRNLGGKYCRETGEERKEVKEDLLFRTTKCQTDKCQSQPVTAKRLRILPLGQAVYEGSEIELICQANSNQPGGERRKINRLSSLI